MALLGPRQAGKITLAELIAEGRESCDFRRGIILANVAFHARNARMSDEGGLPASSRSRKLLRHWREDREILPVR